MEVITARGTWEPQDNSYLLSQVVTRVEDQLGDEMSTYDVQYPAQPNFPSSSPVGVTDTVNRLNAQAADCPDQQFILLGYSQGALVVGDALVDPGLRAHGGDGVVSDDAASRVAAIGMFGSMRFTDGESYNAGTHENGSGRESQLPRTPGELADYEDIIIDYCYTNDWVCEDVGSFLTHLGYIFDAQAQQEVADFVVSTYQGS